MSSMEHEEGFSHTAADAEGATTMHPERDLQPEENMMGATPAEEKKGIAGRVKGMMTRHGRKKHGDHNEDATAATGETGSADSNCGGILHKIKAKVECKVGHGEPGATNVPARLASMARSDSLSSSDEEEIGTVGFAMDPTGPAVAGHNLGREDFTSAPVGPGADLSDLHLSSDDDNGDELNQRAERAVEYAKASNPYNPNYVDVRNSTLNPSEDDTHVASHRSHFTEASNSNLTPSAQADKGLHDHSHLTKTDNSSFQAASEPHPSDSETGVVERDHKHDGHHHNGHQHDGHHGGNVTETFVHKVMGGIH